MGNKSKLFVIWRNKLDSKGMIISGPNFWGIARSHREMERMIRNSWKWGVNFSYTYTER